ncbi:hypothetical protein [Paenibacillus sp.]|uniref:hypothetical protein n=1 Tax=Paenibacillus sp. TaxID=58172 RepID=UPI002D6BB13F|nr:hypothetical protein [Paenibacillus sp.]HZG85772.1 hypothetical protein [Paenibacillus sp.]
MAEVWKKLMLHKAKRALALNVPGGDYAALVGGVPEGVTVDAEQQGENGTYDFVHLFVASVAELEEHGPKALAAIQHDGLLWFSYPKKTSKIKTDINRDTGWKTIRDAGYEGVTQIAVDETWSALRFRPASEIPSLTRKFTND